MQSHRCHPQAVVVALVTMATLSLLMHRHPCHHHDDVLALVMMALLPLMRRRLCIIAMAIVALVAMVSLP
jgi:hypothetical protein